ncbi:hypothetical protein DM860_002729 [Cuscuta australis]|uniref:HTH myb-type domain-containing protein n=1 Tax=Cuscuta australis TaxID=267555 RepID=A0A328D152_9ASTE|nr:hypothetical protein DM860_002729 [Cuscuta australis]
MTDHEDCGGALARVALREGAFLCLEKPISAYTIKYLWQHVLRETSSRSCWEVSNNNNNNNNNNNKQVVFTNNGFMVNNNINDNNAAVVAVKKNKARNNYNHEYSNREKKRSRGVLVCKKHSNTTTTSGEERVLWTEELHSLFMDAIHKLGEGRCFPKEIVETMNVPNLTRMQVASHLQKCRNNDWHGPKNKKKKPNNNNNNYNQQQPSSQGDDGVKKRHPPRFGAMPVVIEQDNAEEESNLDVDDFLVDDLSRSPFYNEKVTASHLCWFNYISILNITYYQNSNLVFLLYFNE